MYGGGCTAVNNAVHLMYILSQAIACLVSYTVILAGQAEQDAADAEYDSGANGEGVSEAEKACLVYRSSQKRIAREYLIRARQELNIELNRMQKLHEKD